MNLYNTEMYNNNEIRKEKENIFDKTIKMKRENKNEQTINNMIEANNIADTNAKAHDTDASQTNRGRSARLADDRDNNLFETKQYEKKTPAAFWSQQKKCLKKART